MKFSSKALSQTITQLCLAKGIDHIVISPGSRNAPLTIGFTQHEDFYNFSIVDERSAAFFGLGLAQQLQKPVVLVCTSGSALLNYYPAIAEAFYSNIPLIVLSADRPSHLIDVGDGQTIRQENVFDNHILYSANCKEGGSHQVYNETEMNIALNTAIELQGPVHINIPFTEPLYETSETSTVSPQDVPVRISSEEEVIKLDAVTKAWNDSPKKMIVVGTLFPDSVERQWLDALAQDKSVIVLTETTSNLHNSNFFPCIDQLIAPLSEAQLSTLAPDVLLTFGGMIVSKKVKAFLRSHSPKHHFHVHPKTANDTFFALTEHIQVTVNSFLASFIPKAAKTNSNYRDTWLAIKEERISKHRAFVETAPFSDFLVYARIIEQLPEPLQLQLSNSTAIRYSQLFDLPSEVRVFCNRGTSGIDGSNSTAIGAAYISSTPTLLLTGDLSFFYDSNAFWNDHIPNDFRIIVVNNSGGGIFRILPNAKKAAQFETFFETKHNLTARPICELYNLEYASARDASDVKEALDTFYAPSNRPRLLEIFTPSEVNDEVLKDYFKRIS